MLVLWCCWCCSDVGVVVVLKIIAGMRIIVGVKIVTGIKIIMGVKVILAHIEIRMMAKKMMELG